MANKYSWPEKPVLIGTSIKRLDGPDKVSGRARYTYDINRPGMIYGKIERSPHAHARVVSIDLSAAQKAPGVKAVLAYEGARRAGDVSGRSGRRRRRRHRRTRARRGAADSGPLRSAAAFRQRRPGNGEGRAGGVQERQHEGCRHAGGGRPRRRLQAGRAHRRADVFDACHHARVHGDTWLRLRVGRRQADRVGDDAGGSRHARRVSPRRSAFRRPTSA